MQLTGTEEEDLMSRAIVIMVSDNNEAVDSAKRHYQGSPDVNFQVYSPHQWREGLENNFFRQQLAQGIPALTSGMSQPGSAQVFSFPTQPGSDTAHVQKMDDIEARAIDNAIHQYKGNLTEAAKALGIGRATLYRKVKQYQIDPSAARKKRIAA